MDRVACEIMISDRNRLLAGSIKRITTFHADAI